MEADPGSAQLHIRFITKEQEYAVSDTPFAVPSSITSTELNTLVNELLQEHRISKHKAIDFEFLINGEFLRVTLQQHLEWKEISSESIVEVEYFKRLPAPEPQDCLLHDDWVSAVHVSNGWMLSGCYDNTAQIWTTKGIHQLTVPGHTGPVKTVSWISVDNETATFLSGSQDQTAMLWEWKIESNVVDCINVYKGHERHIESLSVSPDKQSFASGGWDSVLKIWSTATDEKEDNSEPQAKRSRKENKSATKTPKMTLKGHRDCVSCVTWSDAAEILTSSWDHTLKLWDAELGGIKQELVGNKAFFHIDFSALNRTIVTASADRHIRIYDPRSTDGSLVKNVFTSHSQWVEAVKWSTTEENLFISGSYDNLMKLWDRRSPKAPLFDLTGHEDKILCCDWSDPRFMVSGGADNTVRVYKSKNAISVQVLVRNGLKFKASRVSRSRRIL